MSPRRQSQSKRAGCFPACWSSAKPILHRGNYCRKKERPRACRRLMFREPRVALYRRLRTVISMERLHPRSPYEKLGGYVHLPRLIDKAKLHRKGLLDGYNYKTVGFDKHLLSFLKLDGDAFEEAVHRLENDDAILSWVEKNGLKHSTGDIEHWNQAMISRHPDTAAKKARFSHFLKQSGGAGRKDIRTYFDLIEFDEGRLR